MASGVLKLYRPLTVVGGLFLASSTLYVCRRSYITVQCSSIPPITLYQYQTCPFCCKTRAFLDYYGLDYEKVEVNPIFRKETKFSNYKKVPFVIIDDVQINDSSLIISVLRSCMVLGTDVAETIKMYPEVNFLDSKNREQSERANKYFIMQGEKPLNQLIVNELREEREWREWVDTHLVHTFCPNIYRTLKESLQAFEYISSISNFSTIEKVFARYVGTVTMYVIGKRLKKKYNLKDDVRLSLYECCTQWTEAIGNYRKFMGGDEPNLADLAVYGTLSSMEGLETFNDMLSHTSIGDWYYSVKEKVNNHSERRI